jgi:hypothetical protein
VLREAIEEQVGRWEKGRITEEQLREELIFLADHHQAGIRISQRVGGLWEWVVRLDAGPYVRYDWES